MASLWKPILNDVLFMMWQTNLTFTQNWMFEMRTLLDEQTLKRKTKLLNNSWRLESSFFYCKWQFRRELACVKLFLFHSNTFGTKRSANDAHMIFPNAWFPAGHISSMQNWRLKEMEWHASRHIENSHVEIMFSQSLDEVNHKVCWIQWNSTIYIVNTPLLPQLLC